MSGTKLYGGVEDDFQEFVECVKEAGWRICKEDGEWLHICSECQEEG